jgi:hypothetical protein
LQYIAVILSIIEININSANIHLYYSLQAVQLMVLVQKAFRKATDLKIDPFAIRRNLQETPEIMTPLFKQYELDRANLTARTIIGQGQVGHIITLLPLHLQFDVVGSLVKCTLPLTRRQRPFWRSK